MRTVIIRFLLDEPSTVDSNQMFHVDAYMLLSVAGDVEITELVDRNKGVHVMIPKALFAWVGK